MPETFHHQIGITVPFRDIDKLGHLNNVAYLSYFESLRVALCRGIPELDLTRMDETSENGIIIAEISIRYLAPAFLDQKLWIRGRVSEIRSKGFGLDYEIRDQKTDQKIATGHSVQVLYNYKKRAAIPIPAPVRALLEKWR